MNRVENQIIAVYETKMLTFG